MFPYLPTPSQALAAIKSHQDVKHWDLALPRSLLNAALAVESKSSLWVPFKDRADKIRAHKELYHGWANLSAAKQLEIVTKIFDVHRNITDYEARSRPREISKEMRKPFYPEQLLQDNDPAEPGADGHETRAAHQRVGEASRAEEAPRSPFVPEAHRTSPPRVLVQARPTSPLTGQASRPNPTRLSLNYMNFELVPTPENAEFAPFEHEHYCAPRGCLPSVCCPDSANLQLSVVSDSILALERRGSYPVL